MPTLARGRSMASGPNGRSRAPVAMIARRGALVVMGIRDHAAQRLEAK
jgi:hypothetical protein